VSVYDDKNRPVHQMAPMEGGGVLEILSSIVKQPTEGWTSLFKGIITVKIVYTDINQKHRTKSDLGI
jgi:hypothetical protein